MDELKNIKVSIQEKNEIKKDSPDTLPLNPTAQGFSGAEIRRRLSKSITGEEGSVLSLLVDKMNITSDLFYKILDESDDNSIIEQLKKKLPKDGSEPMEQNLDMDGNEITGVDNIQFNRGTAVGGLGDNDFTIILKNGETFTFSENGLNMYLNKLTGVAKGVNSKDGANMENINDLQLDVLENTGNIADLQTNKGAIDELDTQVALKVSTSDIVDNLTSTDTNKPLSANQGKVLNNDLINLTKNTVGIRTLVSSSSDFTNTTTYDIYGTAKTLVARPGTELILCSAYKKISYRLFCLSDSSNAMNQITFFDSNGDYLLGISAGSSKVVEGEAEVPNNASYVQGVWYTARTEIPYMIGHYKGDNLGNEKLSKPKKFNEGSLLSCDGYQSLDSGIDTKVENLWNKDNLLENKTISGDGFTIVDSQGSYFCPDFIPVKTNEFFGNHPFFAMAYDADMNKLGGRSFSAGDSVYAITGASTIAYVRIVVSEADINIRNSIYIGNYYHRNQENKSHKVIPYENIGYRKTWYYGKKIACLGDSITARDKDGGIATGTKGYQTWLENFFGCTTVNLGVGGTKVSGSTANSMWQDARIETIPLDSDVVIIMGGSNDWASNSVIGDYYTSTSTNEFYGAYKTMLEKINARVPNAMIILMTQPHIYQEDTAHNIPLQNFRDSVHTIGNHYGYPVIDTHQVGINDMNYQTYLADAVHPNNDGYELISNAVYNGLLAIEPIIRYGL